MARPSSSSSERPQHLSRDDVPLNLARAVPDAVDARIPPHTLQGKLAHQSHATENLDRAVGDARNHFGGEELGLRDLAICMYALVETPRGGQREVVRRVDLRDHVGELERHPLEFADGTAELASARCVVEGEVESPTRLAHTRR